mgnify:CR=1 FL=1
MDVGRSYALRIMVFTSFFAVFVLGAVVFLVLTATSMEVAAASNTLMAIALACAAQLCFGVAVIAQIVQGARANRMSTVHQRTLSQVEALVFEYITSATVPLPPSTRDRLLHVKKAAALVSEAINVEERLRPARVMGIPASYALLGTVASITASGVLAAYKSFTAATGSTAIF